MGKAKRDAKRAKKEAEREAKLVAEEAQRERDKRRRVVMAAIPLVSVALALVAYFALDDARMTGVDILVGSLVFLTYSLGAIGASVKPKDRNRSGSINFGTRD